MEGEVGRTARPRIPEDDGAIRGPAAGAHRGLRRIDSSANFIFPSTEEGNR
jgi:hypothetical protein